MARNVVRLELLAIALFTAKCFSLAIICIVKDITPIIIVVIYVNSTISCIVFPQFIYNQRALYKKKAEKFRLFMFLSNILTPIYPKLPNIAIRQSLGVLFINSPNILRRTSIKHLMPLKQLLYQLL